MKTIAAQEILNKNFSFKPTRDQERALYVMSRFLISEKAKVAFLLRGYAGTGKTTLMKTLVKSVRALRLKTFLMSPTGRAAKVLQNYTGKKAFTIHKSIYFREESEEGTFRFVLKKNLHTNTVFVVDEASMISNARLLGSMGITDLLSDMISFVFSGQNCRLLIIGDHAQLPPVHLDVSPALDEALLSSEYALTIAMHEMTQVMRQAESSGILDYATTLRGCLTTETLDIPEPKYDDFPDIEHVEYSELQDELEKCIANYGVAGVKILTRSNKNANAYNGQVRNSILWLEDELAAEDQLMIVKNNYHWIEDNDKIGFLANGDLMEVLKISNIEEMHGLRFCDATVQLLDYPEEPHLECKLMLDSLMVPGPSLPSERISELYNSVREDYAHLPSRKEMKKAIKADPYLNALQVKFSYAVTCHKAQGGQWPVIFIDRGYFVDDMIDKSYLRWLYTAVTRATEKLYFVNFKPRN